VNCTRQSPDAVPRDQQRSRDRGLTATQLNVRDDPPTQPSGPPSAHRPVIRAAWRTGCHPAPIPRKSRGRPRSHSFAPRHSPASTCHNAPPTSAYVQPSCVRDAEAPGSNPGTPTRVSTAWSPPRGHVRGLSHDRGQLVAAASRRSNPSACARPLAAVAQRVLDPASWDTPSKGSVGCGANWTPVAVWWWDS
jgi:hypothetical protein